MSNSAASPDGVSPWNGSRSPSGPGDYVSQRGALGRFGNTLPVFGKTFPGTERSGAVNLPHQSDENREMMVAIAANRTSASPRTLSSASTLQQSNSALTRSL